MQYDSKYTAIIDRTDKMEWSNILQEFEDANFYQTWSYGELNWNIGNVSHLVLKKNGEIVALAQLRIVSLPIIKKGVAYLSRGPVWRRQGREQDYNIFRNMIKALHKVYVVENGLLLRIRPNEILDGSNIIHKILLEEGFEKKSFAVPDRTLIMDLTPSMEELRQNLLRKWRQALARAERLSTLDLDCGSSEEHYSIAFGIYKEMHGRKQFTEFVDMERHGLIQQDLPEPLKMKILICRLNGEPIAAIGWSSIGDVGLPLIAATGTKSVALSTNASNLLWWKMIEDMKASGCRFCDVGGIDPELNPGGYKFKTGLMGKNGRDVCFLDPYEACQSSLSSFLVSYGEKLRANPKYKNSLIKRLGNLF
jgi:lipid II:glycine glycyltransferase (peptidoglycan interpeptide bridge formation enzyme)